MKFQEYQCYQVQNGVSGLIHDIRHFGVQDLSWTSVTCSARPR
jgi:hypothetical protein